jgi:hypothetical protein
VRRNGAAQTYVLAYDKESPGDPSGNAHSGVMRVIDPSSGSLGEPVYLSEITSDAQRERSEPMMQFQGGVYVRPSMGADLRATLDPTSPEARHRAVAKQRSHEEREQRNAVALREKAAREAMTRRGGNESSDEEDEHRALAARGGGEAMARTGDEIDASPSDLFTALSVATRQRHRDPQGRWETYACTPKAQRVAPLYAYPSGLHPYSLEHHRSTVDGSQSEHWVPAVTQK